MPIWLALIPMVVLVSMLALVIKVFGADAIEGGSQISLLIAASVAALLAIGVCRTKWEALENAIIDNVRTSASAIIILLLTLLTAKASLRLQRAALRRKPTILF